MTTESQSDQMEMMLTQLEKVMTETEFQQVSALPEALLTHIYTAKKNEIAELDKKDAKEEQKKSDYKDYIMGQMDLDTDDFEDAKSCLKAGGLVLNQNWRVSLTKNLSVVAGSGEAGKEQKKVIMLDMMTAKYVFGLMKEDKDKWDTEWDKKNAPKKATKVSGGKREKFAGEKKYLNTPEDAEGKDNKFFFKGDEDATFTKPTFTAKDGSYQNIKYKAVKHARYMGGAESEGHNVYDGEKEGRDGMCSGVVGWDRAQGSKALADTDMSYAQFRIRCGGKVDNDFCNGWGFCSGCANKGRFENFFVDKYDFTKGKSMKYNGKTYQQFIVDELEYA